MSNDTDIKDEVKWEQKIAITGDKANPIENPAKTNPNIEDLHCLGITSDNEERATEIQLIIPPHVEAT